MKSPQVYCIGETVLDVIIDAGQAVVRAGGSALNTAVSLGRAGRPVSFISDVASDEAGNMIAGFLQANGVDTQYLNRYTRGKTTVALAFLDERRDAHYSFYKDFTGPRLSGPLPEPGSGDIVLFGSYYAIADETFGVVHSFSGGAAERGAFVLYDPNFRAAHRDELARMIPRIAANISIASLVRGSDDDFRIMFDARSAEEAYGAVRKHGCSSLVYTMNAAGVVFLTETGHLRFPAPDIVPVSTVGAGDAFNAGIIHALFDRGFNPASAIDAECILSEGIRFSTDVCLSSENYIPRPDDHPAT